MSTFEIKSEIYGEQNYESTKLNDGSKKVLCKVFKYFVKTQFFFLINKFQEFYQNLHFICLAVLKY